MDNSIRTEKMTVNVSTLDLAKIDLLVDSLEYTNRSDFCRIAIRDLLEKHADSLERLHQQNGRVQLDGKNPVIGGIGIIRLSRAWLEETLQQSPKVDILVTGILVVDKDVTPQQLENCIGTSRIYGKIQASPEVLAVLKNKASR